MSDRRLIDGVAYTVDEFGAELLRLKADLAAAQRENEHLRWLLGDALTVGQHIRGCPALREGGERMCMCWVAAARAALEKGNA